MFIIEATNAKNWRWISGIFQHHADAQAYFDTIPEPARSLQRIVEAPVSAYPFFIIEKSGFVYGDIGFVRARLRELVPKGEEEYSHFTLYVVREDFAPVKPGTDYMGILWHWHINDEHLAPAGSARLDSELAEIAGDAG